ncbi:MAG: PDZ domain-containing protein, partial [Mariprofundaceae bacterium]
RIKLHGTVVSDERSLAMLSSRPGAAVEVYHVGDVILPGVTLSAVEAMRIVVMPSSGLEEIGVEEGVASGSVSRQRPVTIDRLLTQGTPIKQQVSRDMLEGELRDLGKLITQVRVAPHLENGKIVGFEISSIVPGSIFERIGLQNGDVIQSINGQSLTDPQQAMQMYQELRNASQLSVALLRKQQVRNIQYQIQ